MKTCRGTMFIVYFQWFLQTAKFTNADDIGQNAILTFFLE